MPPAPFNVDSRLSEKPPRMPKLLLLLGFHIHSHALFLDLNLPGTARTAPSPAVRARPAGIGFRGLRLGVGSPRAMTGVMAAAAVLAVALHRSLH